MSGESEREGGREGGGREGERGREGGEGEGGREGGRGRDRKFLNIFRSFSHPMHPCCARTMNIPGSHTDWTCLVYTEFSM